MKQICFISVLFHM